MFEIEKIFTFDAGHVLIHHNGNCSRPHGHTYVLKVRIRSKSLQVSGSEKNMILDYGCISKIVKPMITEYFDHHWLNDTLDTDSPTAEFIAHWIYQYLSPLLPNLYSITICETPSSVATYTPS